MVERNKWGELRELLGNLTGDQLSDLCYILNLHYSGLKDEKIQRILDSEYSYLDVIKHHNFLKFGSSIVKFFLADELTEITQKYNLTRRPKKWAKMVEIIKSKQVTPRTLLGQLRTDGIEKIYSNLKISEDYSNLDREGMIRAIISDFNLRWLEEIMDSAFIMMAMTGDQDLEYVCSLIKEECQKFDIKAERIDEVHTSGMITNEILGKIDSSDFLFVDLSLGRPNVYYELGYCHGIGKDPKKVVLTAKEGTELHFDIRNMRTILYTDPNDLRKKLKERLKAIRNES